MLFVAGAERARCLSFSSYKIGIYVMFADLQSPNFIFMTSDMCDEMNDDDTLMHAQFL